MTKSAVILQPPLVQLNGPYPSGAYLAAFFRSLPSYGIRGPETVRWVDVNNRVFRSLFSPAGISRVFDLAESVPSESLGAAGEDAGREYARFLSLRDRWVGWIDGIVSILTGGDRELAHAFVRSPYAPRGRRMDAFLAGLESEPDADDARVLATLAVEDLADLVTVAVDPAFSLVRYAESISASERSFARVEAALSGPMVREFFEPVYASLWDELEAEGMIPREPGDQTLFCVSVPFPGALVGALAMARSLRARFGSRIVIGMGGGYVNTELRSAVSPRLAEYVDHLCFDRGYGAYAAFFADGRVAQLAGVGGAESGPVRLSCPPAYRELEDRMTREIAPDYADIDFRLYPRLADTPNPMHRLWSDGAWLKAYLAHGCYWHRCSFCDVSLDYIRSYLPVGIERLYFSLRRQALSHGLRGIHLVDEAAPPRALRDFARENLRHAARDGGGILPFWGNIRFERSFSRDIADYLAAGGLAAVSGGIEIAAPSGFESIDKGISLEHLVFSCCAFKEAGILVHGYLIYGYWDEDEAELIDSLEVTRQLFRAGLVDSAFWHKFVLTRHSRVYCEWRERAGSPAAGRPSAGTLSGLEPIDEPGDFADNDLRFRGEEASARYTAPLDAALSAWMAGEGLDAPIRRWFPFPVPAPRVDPNLVGSLVSAYERARDEAWDLPHEREADYAWLAGKPVVIGSDELCFWHLGEEVRGATPGARRVAEGLSLAGGEAVDPNFLASLPPELFSALRRHGLCRVRPI